jgi:Putative transposase/Transposase zinc-binding domain
MRGTLHRDPSRLAHRAARPCASRDRALPDRGLGRTSRPLCHLRTSRYLVRNRHCPKCLTHARDQWLAERQRELLPVGYAHVVFTPPHALAGLALQNKRVVYDLLFQASAATLLEVARTPKHLGAALGFLSVLHTWGQTLLHHPHVHCVVPAGGLSPDGTRWVHTRPSFFLPVKVLSRVFRGKVVAGLRDAFRAGTLTLSRDLQPRRLHFTRPNR